MKNFSYPLQADMTVSHFSTVRTISTRCAPNCRDMNVVSWGWFFWRIVVILTSKYSASPSGIGHIIQSSLILRVQPTVFFRVPYLTEHMAHMVGRTAHGTTTPPPARARTGTLTRNNQATSAY